MLQSWSLIILLCSSALPLHRFFVCVCSGQAFLELATEADLQKCISRSGASWEGWSIKVFQSTPDALNEALAEGLRTDRRGDKDSHSRMAEQRQQRYNAFRKQREAEFEHVRDFENETCVKLIGLPYKATTEEIKAFFYEATGAAPAHVFRHPTDRGIGYCRFNTAEDRAKARRRNKAKLGDRYVIIPPRVDFAKEYASYVPLEPAPAATTRASRPQAEEWTEE